MNDTTMNLNDMNDTHDTDTTNTTTAPQDGATPTEKTRDIMTTTNRTVQQTAGITADNQTDNRTSAGIHTSAGSTATAHDAGNGADPTTIISAQHIDKHFTSDTGTALSVLHDLSFDLHEDEIVAILGRSGAGKSTFLRILAGLVPPSAGTVAYRGTPLSGPNPGVALVFQTFALMPWLTVQDNVELGLAARGVPRGQRTPVALAAIDSIGLDGFESAYPKELSGGMRQRVGIARALVLRPDALFMDEPFSALDVLTAENLRQEVLKLWKEKNRGIKSILIVTHNIEEAVQMADRVVVLGPHPGHLIAQMPVNLPRPRDKHSAAFGDMVDTLYAILTGKSNTEQETAGPAGVAAGTAEGTAATATTATTATSASTSPATSTSTSAAAETRFADTKAGAAQSGAKGPGASGSEATSSAHAGTAGTGTTDAAAAHAGAPHSETATSQPTASQPATSPVATSTDAPAASRSTALPNVTPGGLAGLLDMIAANPDGIDLADLASALSFEVDDLFPLVDAGVMLGVLTVDAGHVTLTAAGRSWESADILEAKRVFAGLALKHAPLVKTIDHALKQSKSQELHGELFLDLLRGRHTDEEARQQFHIAVSWGRYGELFDYDADDDTLTLDEANKG